MPSLLAKPLNWSLNKEHNPCGCAHFKILPSNLAPLKASTFIGSLFCPRQLMKIAFLYTVRANITLFQPYIETLLCSPDIQTKNFLGESLLDHAMGNMPSKKIEKLVHAAIRNIDNQGFDLIVCTCSSIGEYAETSPVQNAKVVRIDKPMAMKAVKFRNIHILATAESTVEPTYKLVCQCAADDPLSVCEKIDVTIVPNAWHYYNNGDHGAYIDAISNTIESILESGPSNSVILLAQASMAPAATFSHPFIPVIASPIMGVQSLAN